MLLAGLGAALPFARSALPLLLNLAAALWLLRLLARELDPLLPGAGHWAPIAVGTVVPVAVLFLPGLAVVGMEHTLHAALTVAILGALTRVVSSDRSHRDARLLIALVATASLVRYESTFIAVGVSAALILHSRSDLRLALGALAAAGLPLAAFGVLNSAMGGYFLPNALVAKSTLRASSGSFLRSPGRAIENLATDPLVLLLAVAAGVYVVFLASGAALRHGAVAVAFLITASLHAFTANLAGELGFERYQAYLIAGGTLFALRAARELVPSERRIALLTSVLLVSLVLGSVRVELTLKTPLAADNTYRQRYQLGRFLGEEYSGDVVATGELGYVSLFHDGPVVDLLGLGDTQVLRMRQGNAGRLEAAPITDLLRSRGVSVVAGYPETLAIDGALDWILVAEWDLEETLVTARDPLQFWALDEAGAAHLERRLRAFEPELPGRVGILYRDDLVRRFLEPPA